MTRVNLATVGPNTINQPFRDFLTEDGILLSQGGNRDANVDGSITPVEFIWVSPIAPPLNQISHCQYINFVIGDRRKIIDPGRFGGLPKLTNGVGFDILDDQENLVFGLESLQQNRDFNVTPDSTQEISHNAEVAKFRFDFRTEETRLRFLPGWGIKVTIRDDLSSLDLFNIVLSGRRETPGIPV